MEICDAEKLLISTQYESFIGTLQKITLKDHVYDDLYKIGNNDLGFFVLKIRDNGKQNMLDSINLLKAINDTEEYINKNIGIIEKENHIITISEWLNGTQPIDTRRDLLPLFFSKLAILNKDNIVNGKLSSMYLDYRYFDNANDLVDWEITYHRKYLSEKLDIKIILEAMGSLKNGISCIINEDMNCGNMFITNDGKCKIIDTEWIIKGINLYQFQHFDFFGFEEKKWYRITDEANECYEAYFETLKLPNEEANEQIRAIELLNVLRHNTYIKYFGKNNDEEIERRIKIIMANNKFI